MKLEEPPITIYAADFSSGMEIRMKKLGILVLMLSILLCGCNREDKMDANKKQFIEIVTQDGDCVGIIDDSKKIKTFIENLDMDSWEYDTHLNEEAEFLYSYISYEVVDDEFFLKGNDQYVIKSKTDLFKLGQEYYVVTGETTDKIPEDVGIYMSEPEKIGLNTSKSAQTILDEWGLQIQDITYDDSDDEVDNDEREIYSEKDVASVSKEQKIEIYNEKDEVVFSTSEISVITDILNATQSSNWHQIEQRPDDTKIVCTIKKYSQKKKQIKKELVVDYTDTLYSHGDEYYVEHRIPYIEAELEDDVEYYKVSVETADYITSYFR